MDSPDPILALRPFVPARDFDLSRRFYERLGFVATHADEDVAIMQLGSFGFILQNFYLREAAENCMLQMLVRDVGAWWAEVEPARLVDLFAVKVPVAPAMQSWGMTVGFIFDPSGVLWHVAEAPV